MSAHGWIGREPCTSARLGVTGKIFPDSRGASDVEQAPADDVLLSEALMMAMARGQSSGVIGHGSPVRYARLSERPR
jgi:hypothetical protein